MKLTYDEMELRLSDALQREDCLKAKLSLVNDLMAVAEQVNKLAQESAEALVKERDGLAVENAELKVSAISLADEAAQIYKRWNLTQQPDGDIVDMQTIHETICACHDTPNTDAWVNEQRAVGVEKFAAHLRTNDNERSPAKLLALGAEEFAAQLRSKSEVQS